jgi:hypothetical protein
VGLCVSQPVYAGSIWSKTFLKQDMDSVGTVPMVPRIKSENHV